MMFCPDCGKEIKDGVQYCPYCGNKIVYGEKKILQENQNFKPDPRKRSFVPAVLSVVILAAVLIGGVLFFNKKTPASENASSERPVASREEKAVEEVVEAKPEETKKSSEQEIKSPDLETDLLTMYEPILAEYKKALTDEVFINRFLDEGAEQNYPNVNYWLNSDFHYAIDSICGVPIWVFIEYAFYDIDKKDGIEELLIREVTQTMAEEPWSTLADVYTIQDGTPVKIMSNDYKEDEVGGYIGCIGTVTIGDDGRIEFYGDYGLGELTAVLEIDHSSPEAVTESANKRLVAAINLEELDWELLEDNKEQYEKVLKGN